MVWFLFVGLSFATGLLRLPWWMAVAWPVASVGLGIYLVAAEPPNYDMHGFGYPLGAFVALVCGVSWLLGRVLAAIAARPG